MLTFARMEIVSAEFVVSSPEVSLCPADTKPEYAFIGRSNVGKSSLINMLTGRKALAKTSATPGKTLLINHFLINKQWYLVDLPGYGFAQRSKAGREGLRRMITGYLLERNQLTNVFVLIDIRHEQQPIDRQFIDWLGECQVPFALVFTKADKLSAAKAKTNVEAYLRTMSDRWEELPPHFITSSTTRSGRNELLTYIDTINKSLLPPAPCPHHSSTYKV